MNDHADKSWQRRRHDLPPAWWCWLMIAVGIALIGGSLWVIGSGTV